MATEKAKVLRDLYILSKRKLPPCSCGENDCPSCARNSAFLTGVKQLEN